MIFERFFYFLRPAFGHGRLGHPQSLEFDFVSKLEDPVRLASESLQNLRPRTFSAKLEFDLISTLLLVVINSIWNVVYKHFLFWEKQIFIKIYYTVHGDDNFTLK